MRPDMAKVIVERPRRGMRMAGKPKGYFRRIKNFGDEGPPIREGIKKRSAGGSKWLNEHLGPLRRYLESQAGRPWDLVFSEICQHINRNSAVQDHVRDHVGDFVITRVIYIDGVLCNGVPGFWFGSPLGEGRWWRSLYVCPRTGLLRQVKRIKKHPKRNPGQSRFVKVSATEVCKYLAGAWHIVAVRPLPEIRTKRRERDVLLNKSVAEIEPKTAIENYGTAVYAVAVRRLSQSEIRQLPIPVDLRV